MAKIIVTEQIDPVGITLLRAAGHEVEEMGLKGGVEIPAGQVADADALLVRIAEVTGELIAACPKLKVISKHGVGVDNIDLDAAKVHGVAVTITPGANSTSVAEHAFALLIALAKNLPTVCGKYREIGFAAKNCAPGMRSAERRWASSAAAASAAVSRRWPTAASVCVCWPMTPISLRRRRVWSWWTSGTACLRSRTLSRCTRC